MLLALALMTQQPLLEVSDHDAATTCAAALRAKVQTPTLADGVPAMYLMAVAASDGDPLQMKDRLVAVSMAASTRASTIGDKADAILAECRTRFPLAWKSTPATLPENGFQRLLICTVSTATYYGMVTTGVLMDASGEADRIKPVFDRFLARMTPALGRAHGLNTPEDMARGLSGGLVASLKIGNMQSIVSACEVAFP
jgi:hypothetical protein